MKFLKHSALTLFLAGSLAAAADGFSVVCNYPETSKLLRNGAVYPDFILDMSDASGWRNFGSTGGHMLKQYPAPYPGDPKRTGLMFTCKLTAKNPKAPGWVGWQYNLDPHLNIVGADEIELDIYAFQKYTFAITARFGSQQGFGVLPCSWSDVVLQLKPNQWNKVRIPIKKSRSSTDTLRFDFNTRHPGIEHQKEYRMLIGAIRFTPVPEEPLAVHSSKIKATPPVGNGLLLSRGSTELADADKLGCRLELQVAKPAEAVFQMSCGVEKFTRPVSLKPPFTVIEAEIADAAKVFGLGKREIRTSIIAGDGAVLAETVRPIKAEFFSAQSMNERRRELIARLDGLEKQHAAIAGAGIAAELPAITLTAARLFLERFIPDDFNRQKQFRIAASELEEINAMLERAETEIAAYRARKLTETPVIPYDPMQPLTIENGVIHQNGQPILLLGPLAGMPAADWSVYASKLGFNSLVVETNMGDWLNIGSGKKHVISGLSDLFQTPVKYNGCHVRLETYLKNARENKLAANLLLSSHYCKNLPSDLQAARSPDATDGNFDWNVLAPEAKEAFRRMYGNIMPHLKGKPWLVSLGTANEPGYRVLPKSEDFQREFILAMTEKYGSVEALNQAWNSRYASWEAIDLPSVFELAKRSSGAEIDWETFVNLKVSSFYGFLKDTLLAELPDKQIWVKLMGGMGYEMLDEEENIRLGQNVSGTDQNDPMWLDHLRSLFPGNPVVNQEWHFVRAAHASNAKFFANRMFLGVSRGMQSATIWRGIRADWASKNHGHSESFSRYPVALESIGRTAWRLRMLYPVLVRLQQLDGGAVRVYFDKNAALIRGKEYARSVTSAYEKLRINPSAVRFVYPNRLDDLRDVRLIAAGALRDIPPESAAKLAQWVADGGTLWLDAPGAWTDCYGKSPELPPAFVKALAARGVSRVGKGAVVTDPDWNGYLDFIAGPIAWNNSAPDPRVECRALAAPDGTLEYLAIVNLENSTRQVQLRSGVHPLRADADDLWNQDSVKLDGTVELAPFEVKLLRLKR